jgi:hypothetical protein
MGRHHRPEDLEPDEFDEGERAMGAVLYHLVEKIARDPQRRVVWDDVMTHASIEDQTVMMRGYEAGRRVVTGK